MKAEKLQNEKKIVLKKASEVAKAERERFPLNIPESQGDLADQAELQIEADLQEQIERARHGKKSK